MILTIITIWIALGLACALWVARWRRTGASRADDCQAAGDPFFYPFGEMPTLPRQRHLIADFNAWGIPDNSSLTSARAPRRNESGGRPASSRSGTAVVLTFRKNVE